MAIQGNKVTIIVASHIKYPMPGEMCYLPLQVGSALAEDTFFLRDDQGNNISDKNPRYSELTGLYWMWKNIHESEYMGLVHYRRYLGTVGFCPPWKKRSILSEKEILRCMEEKDIILPRKRYYIIESVYAHYAHTHFREHLDMARQAIELLSPEMLETFDRAMSRRSTHAFNMFIMPRELCDDYCRWLFPILEWLDERIDYDQYDDFQKRCLGRITELLLDVWIMSRGHSYVDVPVVYTEKRKMLRKVLAFIRSYVFKTKYHRSY